MEEQNVLELQQEPIAPPDGDKPLLWTQGLNREFQVGSTTVHALRDVSIQMMPRQLTVLRGRSGSGKTTLLNQLSALDKPTSGKVYFQEQDLTVMGDADLDKMRRTKVGYVFQSVALISLMSAYENVEFSLRLAKIPKKDWRERAEEALDIVGLKKRMRHRPAELSGGEQQRVAIARAIAHRPDVLYVDEPTAALDTQMGLQVMRIFRDLVEQEGITIVMSTHDPNIMELADHVYTLEDGAIVAEAFNNLKGE